MTEQPNYDFSELNPCLDELMETPEAAKWLKVNPRLLLDESRGQKAKIPGFWINDRTVRYHRKFILAKLAHDAGLPTELIAAVLSERGVASTTTGKTDEATEGFNAN
jgi:hypothetical protein